MQEIQETQVQSLGQEDPLEDEMATHSSILAWRIPWKEEPGGLQHVGLVAKSQTWLRTAPRKNNESKNTRKLAWVPYEKCQNLISLKDSDWYGTNWVRQPEIYRVTPNETQQPWRTYLQPWLPPGWIGMCTLGFPCSQGHLNANLDVNLVNLPLTQAWWTQRSVFHWYDHLAAIFVPSVELEDVIAHIEALTETNP